MLCRQLPELSSQSFIERLAAKSGNRRIPWSGSFELTARCNMHCVHCYVGSSQGRELSTGEVLRILDQLEAQGCLWLLLTGGEPLIRPDFRQIYIHAKKKGFIITLFTNGTTITPTVSQYLAEWPPSSVELTLYGLTEQTYERVTGVRGSHKKCMRGIELLMRCGVPLTLKTMVMTENRHELWAMKSFAEGLGLRFYFDATINKRLDGDAGPASLRITPREVVDLDLADEKRSDDWKKLFKSYSGPPPDPDRLYVCGAGRTYFHIDSVGALSACLMSRDPSYDLRTGTFQEGWDQFLLRVVERKRTRATPCQACQLMAVCGQCPGFAFTETGDPEEPVTYLCEIAHLRARVFGYNIPSVP